MESGLSDPLSPAAVTPTPPPRKRTALTVTLIVSALVLAAGGGVFASNMLRPTPVAASPVSPQTAQAKVTAGSLNAETTVRGKLRFTKQIDLAAARSGVITELPVPDTILAPGAVAYRIDTLPTVVMAGTTPAWRDFATGMTAGPDVKQLEENLRSFGYLDAEPSEDFTWHTRWALRTWQRDLGLPPSDTLSKDLVLFADQPLRVSKLERQLGDRVEAGAKLYRASSTTTEVTASLKPDDAELAPVGATVTVELPGGGNTEGIVSNVGSAEEAPAESGAAPAPGGDATAEGRPGELRIPITVSLADQTATQGLSLVSVTVRLGSVVREDVLTVPVDALIPVDAERFAVEVAGAGSTQQKLLPVTVGAFASGLVEISGEGIREGLEVTVPKR